jgi:hypothetical protein
MDSVAITKEEEEAETESLEEIIDRYSDEKEELETQD